MIILALDTSARHYSMALLDHCDPIATFDSRNPTTGNPTGIPTGAPVNSAGTPFTAGMSVTLFPQLKAMLHESNVDLKAVNLIAVSTGPGMFTGLRVGVVTAKTLAWANQIPIIGVNTLEAIAAQTANSLQSSATDSERISNSDMSQSTDIDQNAAANLTFRPILNAQRQQIFSGAYQVVGDWSVKECESAEIVDRSSWLEKIKTGDLITGAGLRTVLPHLDPTSIEATGARLAPESVWDCSASGIGQVARVQFEAGRRDDLWTLTPFYFRPSAAEEVRLSKRNQRKS